MPAPNPASHFCASGAYQIDAPRQDVLSAPPRESFMTDILLLALGLGFFGLMAAYAAACERV